MFGKTIVKSIMLATNLVVVFILILTLIGAQVSPEKLILTAYPSLIFPIIIILNLFFVLFWIIALKWYFVISLLVLLFSANQINDTLPVHFGKLYTEKEAKPIKILTYNSMMSAGLQKHDDKHINPLFQFILETDADIVCLQEFAISPKEKYLTEKDVKKIFEKYPYQHIWYKLEQSWAKSGVATFSKFPIINEFNINFDSKFNTMIYSDIVINKDTIRLFNNHLESNRLTERDRDLPLQLKNNFDSENLTGTTRHLSRKLNAAYKKRAMQADLIADLIKKSPYKVIVCGDFNDVPVSYTYTTIKGKLKDAFSETGLGLGWTLNLSIYKFRLDYVLYDSAYVVDNYKVSKVNYSDHYPVECSISKR